MHHVLDSSRGLPHGDIFGIHLSCNVNTDGSIPRTHFFQRPTRQISSFVRPDTSSKHNGSLSRRPLFSAHSGARVSWDLLCDWVNLEASSKKYVLDIVHVVFGLGALYLVHALCHHRLWLGDFSRSGLPPLISIRTLSYDDESTLHQPNRRLCPSCPLSRAPPRQHRHSCPGITLFAFSISPISEFKIGAMRPLTGESDLLNRCCTGQMIAEVVRDSESVFLTTCT